MKEESHFFNTINTIDKVSSLLASNANTNNINNDNCCKEMIRALSFYLCQILNNNYYTETYLPDQYEKFENFMHQFKQKKDFVKKLILYFQTGFQFPGDIDELEVKIFIDNVWCIGFEQEKWVLRVLDEGNYNHLSNGKLYFEYEIFDGFDCIHMYREIKFKSIARESAFEEIDGDITRYLDTIMKSK